MRACVRSRRTVLRDLSLSFGRAVMFSSSIVVEPLGTQIRRIRCKRVAQRPRGRCVAWWSWSTAVSPVFPPRWSELLPCLGFGRSTRTARSSASGCFGLLRVGGRAPSARGPGTNVRCARASVCCRSAAKCHSDRANRPSVPMLCAVMGFWGVGMGCCVSGKAMLHIPSLLVFPDRKCLICFCREKSLATQWLFGKANY